MRFRLGSTLRLVIALACLVLMIPFLLSKLDSTASQSSRDSNDAGEPGRSQGLKNSLQPLMSDSLGNYEPKDESPRSGPGEGGQLIVHRELLEPGSGF